jgi:cell division septation protein DedD
MLLGGCAALPVGVQVASYVADGLLYLTTKKSLTDHGLSLVTNKDCSIWRGLSKGELCREPSLDEIEVVVERAPVSDEENTVEVASAYPVPEVESEALARFDTAAGGDDPKTESAAPAPVAVAAAPAPTMPRPILVAAAAPAAPSVPEMENEIETLASGTYLVIGSFAKLGNAERLVSRFDGWPVLMLPAKVDGRRVYRVAVGPVQPGKKGATRDRLALQGIKNAWALKVYDAPASIEVAAIVAEDARMMR